MKKVILVEGGTGNLGTKIVNALLARNAKVCMVVRSGSDEEKLQSLKDHGVTIFEVDMMNKEEVAEACKGVSCIVSALQGLLEVVVDIQQVLLDAAVAAGVPRFIPSDFSSDFTRLPAGENRNFDLRKEFHKQLDNAPIKATSIFNGAFTDILTYNTPVLNLKEKIIGYWGDNPEVPLDFTTMDDTAAFTAEAALDNTTPKSLSMASFQISPKQLLFEASDATGTTFSIMPIGELEKFSEQINMQRTQNPAGENELFPAWQGLQYIHGMFSVHHQTLDNNRYPDLKWTTAREFIISIV